MLRRERKEESTFSIGLIVFSIMFFMLIFYLIQPWLEALAFLGPADFVRMLKIM